MNEKIGDRPRFFAQVRGGRMKKILLVIGIIAGLFMGMGIADASLVTIGTATYGGSAYNLIWDDDNNGNSVIWLDYTRGGAASTWQSQMNWAAGLGVAITSYNLDPGYSVTWTDPAWRLPSAGTNPQHGYNQTTSEMGHLYYDELGNPAHGPLNNTGGFANLIDKKYWSATEWVSDTKYIWGFDMATGAQVTLNKNNGYYGLAVRSGQVSTVPIPGALWLLGSGLFGLLVVRRKDKNS